jgi:hypothetical protein
MPSRPVGFNPTEAVAEIRKYGSHVLRQAWDVGHLARLREAIVRYAEIRRDRVMGGQAKPLEKMMNSHGAGILPGLLHEGLLTEAFLAEMFADTAYHRICVDYFGAEELYIRPPRLGFRMHDPRATRRTLVPFHQDSGSQDKRIKDVLNCWIPLDPGAGADAPGLEVVRDPGVANVPIKDFGLVSENAVYDPITIDPDAVIAAHGDRLMAPTFEVGDGLVFSQHVIHRTHVTAQMDKPRINFEFRVFSLNGLAPGVSPEVVRETAFRIA